LSPIRGRRSDYDDCAGSARVNATKLKCLVAAGVIKAGKGVRAIYGSRAGNLMTDMQEYLQQAGEDASCPMMR
jgi:hypothetical protein